MKRFRRWLFNGIAALSLLLFAATVALWVRGSRIGDQFDFDQAIVGDKGGTKTLYACRGFAVGGGILIDYAIVRIPPDRDFKPGASWRHDCVLPSRYLYASDCVRNILRGNQSTQMTFDRHSLVHLYQFGVEWTTLKWSIPGLGEQSHLIIAAPLWCISGLFLVLPLIWDIGHRRRLRALSRSLAGRCHSCDYDLRATPDRCPECGAIPEK